MTSKGILWAVPVVPLRPRPSIQPTFPVVPHFHITLLYGVDRPMVQHMEGLEFVGQAKAIVTDDRAQAILWKLPRWLPYQNRYPHTTLSHVEGVEPNYSNFMFCLETGTFKTARFACNFRIEFHAWEDPQ